MGPIITPIHTIEDMFGLSRGTALKTQDGIIVVYYAPEKREGFYDKEQMWWVDTHEWNLIERVSPTELDVYQTKEGYIEVDGKGEIELSIPGYHHVRYNKNGGPLHKCYFDYSKVLTNAGIPEEVAA